MKNPPSIPADLVSRVASWNSLTGDERGTLARSLRACGLSYSEIRSYLPIPKSTLSGWVSDVDLSGGLRDAIESRRLGKDNHRDTQWRRRLEIEDIRREAVEYARHRLDDSFFVAGVCLYWGEGAKTRNHCSLNSSDPALLRLFVGWVRKHLNPDAELVLSLHPHEGNDDLRAQAYWADVLNLDNAEFTKTYVKQPGTGHRKNHLAHGLCRVRVRRSADHWNRVTEWIEVVANELNPSIVDTSNIPSGR
jgi:hypothetical protein